MKNIKQKKGRKTRLLGTLEIIIICTRLSLHKNYFTKV